MEKTRVYDIVWSCLNYKNNKNDLTKRYGHYLNFKSQ